MFIILLRLTRLFNFSNISLSIFKAYLVTLAKIQDTPALEVARSHSSCILSFDLIGLHQNKRFHVTEIVLPLGFADVILRRERSDDRKYLCGSQARRALTLLHGVRMPDTLAETSGGQRAERTTLLKPPGELDFN